MMPPPDDYTRYHVARSSIGWRVVATHVKYDGNDGINLSQETVSWHFTRRAAREAKIRRS